MTSSLTLTFKKMSACPDNQRQGKSSRGAGAER
jgi:hypothetical protein